MVVLPAWKPHHIITLSFHQVVNDHLFGKKYKPMNFFSEFGARVPQKKFSMAPNWWVHLHPWFFCPPEGANFASVQACNAYRQMFLIGIVIVNSFTKSSSDKPWQTLFRSVRCLWKFCKAIMSYKLPDDNNIDFSTDETLCLSLLTTLTQNNTGFWFDG